MRRFLQMGWLIGLGAAAASACGPGGAVEQGGSGAVGGQAAGVGGAGAGGVSGSGSGGGAGMCSIAEMGTGSAAGAGAGTAGSGGVAGFGGAGGEGGSGALRGSGGAGGSWDEDVCKNPVIFTCPNDQSCQAWARECEKVVVFLEGYAPQCIAPWEAAVLCVARLSPEEIACSAGGRTITRDACACAAENAAYSACFDASAVSPRQAFSSKETAGFAPLLTGALSGLQLDPDVRNTSSPPPRRALGAF